MSLENKVAIVTGSDSGIGHAIALELAPPGRRGHDQLPQERGRGRRDVKARSRPPAARRRPSRPTSSSRRRHPEARRRDGRGLRATRHHGQQRRDGDADVDARHDRAPVRPGHRDRPQERLLRRPAGGQADDQAGWRRPDHQHLVDPRGLADARQLAVLRGQGRRPDADPDGRRRARAARHHGGRRRARRGPHADRRGHAGRPGRARRSSRARSRSAASPSPRRSPTSWRSLPRTGRRTARRRPTWSTAG